MPTPSLDLCTCFLEFRELALALAGSEGLSMAESIGGNLGLSVSQAQEALRQTGRPLPEPIHIDGQLTKEQIAALDKRFQHCLKKIMGHGIAKSAKALREMNFCGMGEPPAPKVAPKTPPVGIVGELPPGLTPKQRSREIDKRLKKISKLKK